MFPKYDLNKIKYAVSDNTFEKAVELYNKGKVKNFEDQYNGFTAIVQGSQDYRVFVDWRNINRGGCNCYLGEHGTLCKHIVALAIYAIFRGVKLKKEDTKPIGKLQCSDNIGELDTNELLWFKYETSEALKCIKPYLGPSKTWDANQASLSEGCSRFTNTFNKLPISPQTTELIIKILLKLDKKLSNSGIDDSNGIVGGFIEQSVYLLEQFADIEPACIKKFKLLTKQNTSFGWEKPLVKIYDKLE